jgi:hypothetical protein
MSCLQLVEQPGYNIRFSKRVENSGLANALFRDAVVNKYIPFQFGERGTIKSSY